MSQSHPTRPLCNNRADCDFWKLTFYALDCPPRCAILLVMHRARGVERAERYTEVLTLCGLSTSKGRCP